MINMNKHHSALIVGLTSITFFTGCVVFTNISDLRQEQPAVPSTMTSDFQTNSDLGNLASALVLPPVPLYTTGFTPAEEPAQSPAPIVSLPPVQELTLQQEAAATINLPPVQPIQPPVTYQQEPMQPTIPDPTVTPPPSVTFVPSPIPAPSAPPVPPPVPAKQKTTKTRAS
jgi:hypothetical protein